MMTTRTNISFPVLDGGIGWWIVVSGVISNFIAMGLYRCGGIIYLASIKTFSASRTVAAWVPMVTMMLVFFTAPISTCLSTRFTFHRIIFIGALLATLGMLINFLANNLELLFVGWSLFFGVGSSLAFFPALAIVGQCFKEKRPLANGIVLAGGAVGSVCMPPILEYLIDEYGLNGACLIIAGLPSQYFVTASILRTVYNVTRKPVKTIPNLTEIPLMDEKMELEEEKERNKFCADFSFLKNFTFVINGMTSAIQVSLFLGMVTILPDLAVEETGVSRIQAAYLVSATAFADLTSRLFGGICLLKLKTKKSLLYTFVLVVNALDFVILAFLKSYSLAIFAAVVGGAMFAFGIILYFEILASCQSPEDYPTAFGISELIKSPILLITATSLGSLKDATGNYKTTFLLFAGAEVFAIILWIIEILRTRKLKSKTIDIVIKT